MRTWLSRTGISIQVIRVIKPSLIWILLNCITVIFILTMLAQKRLIQIHRYSLLTLKLFCIPYITTNWLQRFPNRKCNVSQLKIFPCFDLRAVIYINKAENIYYLYCITLTCTFYVSRLYCDCRSSDHLQGKIFAM